MKYYYKNKALIRSKKRPYDIQLNQRKRRELLEMMGMECVACGYSDYRALQIDHVYGGGRADRKNKGMRSFLKHVMDKIKNGSDEYQILCANCNSIKRVEHKQAPYKKDI